MTIRRSGILLLMLAGTCGGFAQNSGTCAAPVAFPAKAGMTITIESRSGEVDIVGSDQAGVRVSCTLNDSERSGEVRIRFEQTGDFAKLDVRGGPTNNVRIRIEVPKRTDLKLRVPAGELRVDQVSGDKDVDLNAGEIVISDVNAKEYRTVDATVDVGAVSASAFGVGKGGFFRSFSKDSPGGRYRLRAHLISGNVQLN